MCYIFFATHFTYIFVSMVESILLSTFVRTKHFSPSWYRFSTLFTKSFSLLPSVCFTSTLVRTKIMLKPSLNVLAFLERHYLVGFATFFTNFRKCLACSFFLVTLNTHSRGAIFRNISPTHLTFSVLQL